MKIKQVALLKRDGEIMDIFPDNNKKTLLSSETYPIIIENYIWDEKKQVKSAEKYKDQIKRVFYPEKIEDKVKVMLQDDIRRLKLVSGFNYGKKVLEIGCSDGSVSIKIAQLNKVRNVIGIDIRRSAISDGKKLIKDLLKRKEINKKDAGKVKLIHGAIEKLSVKLVKFDSVCAYEIFEHLAPQDLLPVFQKIHKLIKKNGSFFVSVPNRFPGQKYDKQKRSRWKWFDHRNFFSQASLEIFLRNFFKQVRFYPLYKNEKVEDSLYLICECRGKIYEA
jgi:2-polyprenyl-3-methyl-5-hydroxy-6-metoxy-1,4-benzoquinol methylase